MTEILNFDKNDVNCEGRLPPLCLDLLVGEFPVDKVTSVQFDAQFNVRY